MQLSNVIAKAKDVSELCDVFTNNVQIELGYASDIVTVKGYDGSVSTDTIARKIMEDSIWRPKQERSKELAALLAAKVFLPLKNLVESRQNQCTLYQMAALTRILWTPPPADEFGKSVALKHAIALSALDQRYDYGGSDFESALQQTVGELRAIGAIRDGSIDLMSAMSRPRLLKTIARLMEEKVGHTGYTFICGALNAKSLLATTLSLEQDKPLIMARTENLRGIYKTGEWVLIVADELSSGNNILETVDKVKSEGLIVQEVVVLLDREQGGVDFLKSKGIKVQSVLTVSMLN
jgi:adenine/guanine phosphoribosyltransferase-like PRPP-binding protein